MAALFGVPQLDQAFGEPASGSALLIRNEPATDATPLLLQAVSRWLGRGAPAVYLAVDRAPGRVPALLADWGHRADHGLQVVDAHSARSGLAQASTYRIERPDDLDAVAQVLERAADDHPGALLAIDSLSGLLDLAGASDPRRFTAAFGRFAMAVAVWTDWHPEGPPPHILDVFPNVVRLRGVAERVVRNEYFCVERAAGRRTAGRPVLFRARRRGGVHAYIPKVLVTGPYNAGKSTFVRSVSDTVVGTEHRGTTVAMDRGTVTMHGLVAEVFGTPGQERFDPLLDTLAAQAVGVVLVVDATAPDDHARAARMLRHVWKKGLPSMVVANKHDHPGALPLDEITARLDLPTELPVVPCDASDRAESRAVLNTLLERILGGRP